MHEHTPQPSQIITPGILYVVATPIGNLGEMSPRAREILSSVDLIACEDTRHTKKLCSAFDITTPLTSYYREQEQKKSEKLVDCLLQGNDVALVSDAGTPGLSDPGGILVAKAREAGIEVQSVAGPSALAAALSISGIRSNAFFFGGFPPAKKNDRRRFLRDFRSFPWPLVFYESPHRIRASLKDMHALFGNRRAILIRELTKIHEECLEASLTELIDYVEQGVKGELVVIVHGAEKPKRSKPENLEELVAWYRDEQDATLKDTVQAISADLDLPRSTVYKNVLKIWKKE